MTRLTRASLTHRTVAMLLSLLIIAVGVYAAGILKQELIPSMDIPRASIVAIYPGASPEVVERDVAKRLESAVRAVNGVTRVTSVSSSGAAQLRAEWDYGTSADKVVGDIRTAVDSTRAAMPAEVTTRVVAGSFDDIPVLVLAVSSDADPETFAAAVRDVVVPRMKTVRGVREVTLSGTQAKQVSITLRQDALTTYGVDPGTIGQFFAANATAIPAGTVRTGTDNLDVQVGRTFASVDDIKQLRLQGTDGPLELQQVADVAIQPVDSTTISRVNGKPSLTLMVTKTVDGNTVTVAQGVRALLPDLARGLGDNAAFATVFDQSPFIEQSIHDLTVEGGMGLAMAIFVILLFLGSLRPTLITALSIPLSLFIALVGLWVGGFTLNILTLGALTVAIGRVVDDSIVVIENIKRHNSLGHTGPDAIVAAVKEVAGAITSSTLTTVAVFLPIGLVGGQAGEMFRPFAVTVTVALLASLLVALTVVPVLASWFMGSGARPLTPAQQARADAREARIVAREQAADARALAAFEKARDARVARLTARGASEATIAAAVATLASRHGQGAAAAHDDEHGAATWLQRSYLPALRWALAHRALTLLIALGLFAGTMALAPHLKTDFIGEAGQVSIQVVQDLPAGTSLQQTDAMAKKVEAVIAAEPTVQTYSTSIGGTTNLLGMGVSDTNHASYTISLAPHSKGVEVAERLRREIVRLGNAGTVQVVIGQSSNQVIVYVEGSDLEHLKQANQQVSDAMASLPGLVNVSSDLGAARRMLAVSVDPAKAAGAGMTQAQVGVAVLRAVHGQKVGTYNAGVDTLDVLLRSQAPVTVPDALADIVLPITQKQTIDARKAAADAVTARQEAFTAKQKADATASFNEQLKGLRDSRAKLQAQLDQARDQLKALQKALATPLPPLPPGVTPPVDPYAQVKAQIAQVTAGIAQLQGQIAALDTQESKAIEARTKGLATQATSQSIAEDAKAAQKATASALRLADVASVAAVDAPATITRVDGNRSATITATPSGTDLGGTTAALKAKLAELRLPAGTSVRIGGVSQQQADSFAQLGLAMVVAVGIVYLIMVGTFGSLVQPLILLVSVPFAATGAIGLLLATDTPLGIPSMIGLLMLIGIVVTNAIVLIDLINQFRRRGASVDDAVMHGARLRLRPIIMTALATIMALVPMGLGVTGGGVFISKPLAIVVIGGLVSSTVLTLILVPVLYDLVEKARERVAGRRRPAPAA